MSLIIWCCPGGALVALVAVDVNLLQSVTADSFIFARLLRGENKSRNKMLANENRTPDVTPPKLDDGERQAYFNLKGLEN